MAVIKLLFCVKCTQGKPFSLFFYMGFSPELKLFSSFDLVNFQCVQLQTLLFYSV